MLKIYHLSYIHVKQSSFSSQKILGCLWVLGLLKVTLEPHLHDIHFGSGTLTVGTLTVNLGHGLRHLHDKNEFDLFQY